MQSRMCRLLNNTGALLKLKGPKDWLSELPPTELSVVDGGVGGGVGEGMEVGSGGGGGGEGGGGEGEGGGGEGEGGGGGGEGEGGVGGSLGNESGKRQARCCAVIWQAVSELCRARCSGSLSTRSDD